MTMIGDIDDGGVGGGGWIIIDKLRLVVGGAGWIGSDRIKSIMVTDFVR